MSAQHTPTPWRIDNPAGDEKPSIVSMTADGKVDYYIAEMIGCYKAGDADAAFIVLACNAHDELIAALRTLMGRAIALDKSSTHDGLLNCDAITKARAALAKAGAA